MPFSGTTTDLIQLILKRGLVAKEGQQNNLLYQSLHIVTGIRIGDGGKHYILVPLPKDPIESC